MFQTLHVRTSSAQRTLITQKHGKNCGFYSNFFFITLHGRNEAHGMFNVSLSSSSFPHLFPQEIVAYDFCCNAGVYPEKLHFRITSEKLVLKH